ncbi:hypothetical protein TWF694_005750 [Orbilia ellipsospora]|uniref:Uncharacterized protein n=1 Tax=Orbilia ellipsospora TaxID=2528407 RepID=A0AAV9WRT3_9PEZI
MQEDQEDLPNEDIEPYSFATSNCPPGENGRPVSETLVNENPWCHPISDFSQSALEFSSAEALESPGSESLEKLTEESQALYSCPPTDLRFFLSLDKEETSRSNPETQEEVEELVGLLSEKFKSLSVPEPTTLSTTNNSSNSQGTSVGYYSPRDGFEPGQSNGEETTENMQASTESVESTNSTGSPKSNPLVADTPFNRYAQKHEHEFQEYIRLWKAEGERFINLAKEVAGRREISFIDATDLLAAQLSEDDQHRFLPYHVYLQILHENRTPNQDDHGSCPDMLTVPEISAIIEGWFWVLKRHCDQMHDSLSHYSLWLTSWVVHVPRILREYGSSSFSLPIAYL